MPLSATLDAGPFRLDAREISGVPDAVVVAVDGCIAADHVVYFQSFLARLHINGARNLILDCRLMSTNAPMVPGTLVRLADCLAEDVGTLILADLQPSLARWFARLGFDQVFHICDTVDEAEAELRVRVDHTD